MGAVMVRQILRVLVFLNLLEISFAGTVIGRVAEIEVSSISPIVFVRIDGKLVGTPRCNESQRFVIDVGKPGGKNSVDALWSAKNFDHSVEVLGLNTCRANWHAEDVKKVIVR